MSKEQAIRLPAVWFQGLPADHKDSRYKSILNWLNDPVTKLFLELLRKDESRALGDVSMDDHNWNIKSAYMQGQREMLRKIERLTQYE